MDLGVRTWGNDPDGKTMMLIGAYQTRGDITQRLLGALPALLVLPADTLESPLVPLLGSEIVKDEPGQEAVLDLPGRWPSWPPRPACPAPPWPAGSPHSWASLP
jgi:hypothetical protein